MIISDLDRSFHFSVVAGGVDPGSGIAASEAGVTAPGYRMPIDAIDFEFVHDQIICVANGNSICFGIEIHHVARTRRTPGQPFTLSDREHLDAVMFTEK